MCNDDWNKDYGGQKDALLKGGQHKKIFNTRALSTFMDYGTFILKCVKNELYKT